MTEFGDIPTEQIPYILKKLANETINAVELTSSKGTILPVVAAETALTITGPITLPE